MAEKDTTQYKYAVVQVQTNNQYVNYVVICSKWIVVKGIKKSFFWPREGQWENNKKAVRDCLDVNLSEWMEVRIKYIVKYSNDFNNALHCCVALKYFDIDASQENQIDTLYHKLAEYLNCKECSKVVHATVASLAHDDAAGENGVEPKSSTFFSTQSAALETTPTKVQFECDESSPSLIEKSRNIARPATPSLLTSTVRRGRFTKMKPSVRLDKKFKKI